MTVRLANSCQRADTEIAQAALAAIKWHTVVPENRVTPTVKDGWITLAGELDWQYQKDAAARRAWTACATLVEQLVELLVINPV